jgi:hypothetical protein
VLIITFSWGFQLGGYIYKTPTSTPHHHPHTPETILPKLWAPHTQINGPGEAVPHKACSRLHPEPKLCILIRKKLSDITSSLAAFRADEGISVACRRNHIILCLKKIFDLGTRRVTRVSSPPLPVLSSAESNLSPPSLRVCLICDEKLHYCPVLCFPM